LNFFSKLEGENEEYRSIVKQLAGMEEKHLKVLSSHGATLDATGMLVTAPDDKDRTKLRMLVRACEEYAKRKNIIEFKLTKLKFSRVAKYISGNPKGEGSLNPFTAPYKPSVYSENVQDPKMDIPQNDELF